MYQNGTPEHPPDVTPLKRLLDEVLSRHPTWTQSSIAARAGIERSTLNQYVHSPGRTMKRATREALATAMRIPQWELDEAAAEQAGYVLKPPSIDLEAQRLINRARDLSDVNRDRWLRLARALVEALAAEVDRPTDEQSSPDAATPIMSRSVTTDQVTAENDEPIVQADVGQLAEQTAEEREYVDMISDAALNRLRRRLLGE